MTSTREHRYYEDVAVGDEYTEDHLPTTEQVEEYLKTWMSSSGPVTNRFSNNDEAQRLGLARDLLGKGFWARCFSRSLHDRHHRWQPGPARDHPRIEARGLLRPARRRQV